MILLTGSQGLLGSYLKLEADRPSHKEFNINNYVHLGQYKQNEYDLIVHCAAFTDVQGAETNKSSCFEVNVMGTLNLLEAFPNTPFVLISSEYAQNPVNFYSLTKRMAEQLVERHSSYLIIRTLFKATPWPFEKAFEDQYTMGGYVSDVAPKIDEAIMKWDRKGSKLIYVGDGQGRKTMYQLARKTKPNVIKNSIKEMKVPIQADYL